MKNGRRAKAKSESSLLKRYLKEKTKQFWDEALELLLCYILSSHAMDQLITWSQGTVIHDLLQALQTYQNLVGILKIAFPLLLFLIWRFIRRWATFLILLSWRNWQSARSASIQIDVKKSPNAKRIVLSKLETVTTYGMFLAFLLYDFDFRS